MKYADLHIHSTCSDGVNTPEKIIEIAMKNQVKYISITDHDSIAAQYIINKSSEKKEIKIIPGIELSAEYNGLEIHILGYFIDIKNKDLIQVVNSLNEQRITRVEEILSKLKKYDINLDINDIALDLGSTIGRSHIANAMVDKGYFENYKNAFRSYLIQGKPGYVKGFKLDYKEALDIIKIAGGIPVLAHPGQIYKKREIENIIKELRCFGLKGVEVYHPSHTCEDINKLFNIAKKYKLSISGGSDCHGRCKNIKDSVGSCGLTKDLLEKFISCKK